MINIIGYGFVGQATGLGLKKLGYEVVAHDIVSKKNIYKDKDFKKIPLKINKKPEKGINIVCIADKVKNGKQKVEHIKTALNKLEGMIILRTTLLPRHLSKMKFDFYWVEFLHERTAIKEFLFPDLVVVGRKTNKEFPFEEFNPHYCTPEQASHIKYLSNIWNALRITFVNEFGDKLKQRDKVIDFFFRGEKYLKWGNAFGGHCLPKDISAYANEYNLPILKAVIKSNDKHFKEYPNLKSIY